MPDYEHPGAHADAAALHARLTLRATQAWKALDVVNHRGKP